MVDGTHTLAVSKKFPPKPTYVSKILNEVSLSHLPYVSLWASPKVMVPRHMGETMSDAEGESCRYRARTEGCCLLSDMVNGYWWDEGFDDWTRRGMRRMVGSELYRRTLEISSLPTFS